MEVLAREYPANIMSAPAYASGNLAMKPQIFVFLVLSFLVCLGALGWTQAGNAPPLPPAIPGQPQTPEDQQQQDPWIRLHKQQLTKKENVQRQKEIKKDTDQLLALATELKQYVDKTNENTMSLDVIKKAEQIEKLAKSVSQKMKGPS